MKSWVVNILLGTLIACAVLEKSAGHIMRRQESTPAAVVAQIRALLQDLQDGISGTDLKEAYSKIVVTVDEIMANINVDFDENEVEDFLGTLMDSLQSGDADTVQSEFDRAFYILAGLADELENTVDEEEQHKLLLSISGVATKFMTAMGFLGEGITFYFAPNAAPKLEIAAVRRVRGTSPGRRCIFLCWGK